MKWLFDPAILPEADGAGVVLNAIAGADYAADGRARQKLRVAGAAEFGLARAWAGETNFNKPARRERCTRGGKPLYSCLARSIISGCGCKRQFPGLQDF